MPFKDSLGDWYAAPGQKMPGPGDLCGDGTSGAQGSRWDCQPVVPLPLKGVIYLYWDFKLEYGRVKGLLQSLPKGSLVWTNRDR